MRKIPVGIMKKGMLVFASSLLLGLTACSIDQAETNKHASGPFTPTQSAPLESTHTIQ